MSERWAPYLERYRRGEWRDRIFRDLVLEEARALGAAPTILDIGCGRGLDGSVPLQRSIAAVAGRFLGIEPDPEIPLEDYFTETFRCPFEEAPLRPGSVHLAFAVMVLEHLPSPAAFWGKLGEVLADGGVFWALTVDARHPFCRASLWAERLRLKDAYFHVLHGKRGVDRYENYRVFYRSNAPGQIEAQARGFRELDFLNFSKVGQWSPYFPRPLRPLIDSWDRHAIGAGRPGTLLAIRAAK
jgi:SAM-dependent methyltransferase